MRRLFPSSAKEIDIAHYTSVDTDNRAPPSSRQAAAGKLPEMQRQFSVFKQEHQFTPQKKEPATACPLFLT